MTWKLTDYETGQNLFFDVNKERIIVNAHPDNEFQTFIGRNSKTDVGPKLRQNMRISFTEVPAFCLLKSGSGPIHDKVLSFAKREGLPIKEWGKVTTSSYGVHVIVAGQPIPLVRECSETHNIQTLNLSHNLLCVGGDEKLACKILSLLEESYDDKNIRGISNNSSSPIDNRPRAK